MQAGSGMQGTDSSLAFVNDTESGLYKNWKKTKFNRKEELSGVLSAMNLIHPLFSATIRLSTSNSRAEIKEKAVIFKSLPLCKHHFSPENPFYAPETMHTAQTAGKLAGNFVHTGTTFPIHSKFKTVFMLVTKKLGNLSSFHDEGRAIDRLPLEWHETGKRSLRRKTGSGRDMKLHLEPGGPHLQQDDVLFADENCLVVVEILACETIVLKLSNLYQAARACYAIGNKNLPLFFEDDAVLLPFEGAAYAYLQEAGFEPQRQNRKLLQRLGMSNSEPASRSENRENFFARIFKLSTASFE